MSLTKSEEEISLQRASFWLVEIISAPVKKFVWMEFSTAFISILFSRYSANLSTPSKEKHYGIYQA